MTTPLATVVSSAAAVALSSRSTVTTDLFAVSSGACSLAVSIAKVGTQSPSAQETGDVVLAQPMSNPDIAGIGILISFIATAYGIFIWMVIAYLCRWLPPSLLGQVDEFVFNRPGRKGTSPPWWQYAVDQSILCYADLQIATGIGILTAAFSTMSSLSVYHLQVAIYLAWMSSNTHLTAVSLLQTEFRENKNKSTARRLRVAGMALLGVMLLVALVPTTGYNWLAILTRSVGHGKIYGALHEDALSSAGIPARCFWDRRYSGDLIPDAAWSFIILIFSYLWKGLLLFRPTQRYLKVSCRRKIHEPLREKLDRLVIRLEETPRKDRLWLVFQYKLAFCAYLAVWALFELAQSFVISLWICGAGLVWGSLQILEPRRTLPPQTSGSENSWSFGQILPMLLLAVPILSFSEDYTIRRAETLRRESTNDPPPGEGLNRQHVDEESMLPHAAIGNPRERQADNSMLFHIQTEPLATPDPESKPEENIFQTRRFTKPEPPWRSDKRIYASRFVQFAFWGSQIGIASLGALFIVFYFELFVPLGIPSHSELQTTLQTDYGIWFIVGCTILGWIGMTVCLLAGGATFSSLFAVDGVVVEEGT